MVTLFEEMDVVLLQRAAVKVTDWPTVGVEVDGERVSFVVLAASTGVEMAATTVNAEVTITETNNMTAIWEDSFERSISTSQRI